MNQDVIRMSFKLTLVTGYTEPGSGLWIRQIVNPQINPYCGTYRGAFIEGANAALAGGTEELRELDSMLEDDSQSLYGLGLFRAGCIACQHCGMHHDKDSHTIDNADTSLCAENNAGSLWTAIIRVEHKRYRKTKIDYTDGHVPLDKVDELVAEHDRYAAIKLPDAQASAAEISRQIAELFRLAVCAAELDERQRLASNNQRLALIGGVSGLLTSSADYVDGVRAMQTALRATLPQAAAVGALPADDAMLELSAAAANTPAELAATQ